MQDIKNNYLVPALEHFNGGPAQEVFSYFMLLQTIMTVTRLSLLRFLAPHLSPSSPSEPQTVCPTPLPHAWELTPPSRK